MLRRITLPFNFHTNAIKRLLPLLVFISFGVNAQQAASTGNGKITGRVIDSTTGQPVSYASVSLAIQDNDKEINGATTDDKGVFKLTDIAEGTYKVHVLFIGYQTRTKINIVISKAQPTVSLGDIKLPNTSSTLKTVTVQAEKSLIEVKIDKMVYNVDKDLTSQGGVATDALKKIPEVSVDVDGNVELQGNSNIRFLIDGKPSTIFGTNIVDVLQAIPASQIQSIEVITSPGAKYDAEGTGGIINIILKKSTAKGFNASISLSGGTKFENTSINLNARQGNFGVYGYFSGNATLLSTTTTNINRTAQDTNNQTTKLLQNGSSSFTREGFQTGGGFDWEITPKDNIYGGVSYNFYKNDYSGTALQENLEQDISGSNLSDITDLLNTSNAYNQHSMDYYLNYKKTFAKKDQELDVLANYSTSYTNLSYNQTQEYVPSSILYDGSTGNNPGSQSELDLSIDYTQPVNDNLTFDMGAKTTLNEIKSTSDVYLLNAIADDYGYSTTESSTLDYKQNIYAAYVSATFKLFNFLDVKAGFRDEYTQTNAYFSNSGNVNVAPYNTYVPSAVISHTFKNNQTLKFTYSYRIQRPGYSDLNPFVNASDPKNLSTGNPNLKPEIGNKIEAGYNKIFEKDANLFITLFYRWSLQDLQPYTYYFTSYKVGDSTYTNTTVTERANIGEEQDIGLSISGSIPILKKIKIRPNIQLFQRYITTGFATGGNASGFNYRINANANYEITDNLSLELFGNFNSPRVNAQGTQPAFFTYNFAIRQQLFKKKGSIALTATNPFNYYVNQVSTLYGDNFTTTTTRDLPYQSFGINFTYRFGKMDFKPKKDDNPDPNLEPPQGN
ncbi:MAG TPA: TonB-dependent receptor [Bacteroidia bacterium]|jgi:ferric enterobactin receptor|nr:TonB-dependent receptor [Bacteroidia bacterium]